MIDRITLGIADANFCPSSSDVFITQGQASKLYKSPRRVEIEGVKFRICEPREDIDGPFSYLVSVNCFKVGTMSRLCQLLGKMFPDISFEKVFVRVLEAAVDINCSSYSLMRHIGLNNSSTLNNWRSERQEAGEHLFGNLSRNSPTYSFGSKGHKQLVVYDKKAQALLKGERRLDCDLHVGNHSRVEVRLHGGKNKPLGMLKLPDLLGYLQNNDPFRDVTWQPPMTSQISPELDPFSIEGLCQLALVHMQCCEQLPLAYITQNVEKLEESRSKFLVRLNPDLAAKFNPPPFSRLFSKSAARFFAASGPTPMDILLWNIDGTCEGKLEYSSKSRSKSRKRN